MSKQAPVSTVRVVDPRIEPQPDPTYATTISPKQNQFYKIPASGLSNSYITFNNLTTLGANRAYLDTFELEITVDISFDFASGKLGPRYDRWTFESFPFNKCCDEARVNINGGAFFSSPLSYVRAKERYWDAKLINDSYGNVCPITKPYLQSELGVQSTVDSGDGWTWPVVMMAAIGDGPWDVNLPTRMGQATVGFMKSAMGPNSSCNNSIVAPYELQEHPVIRVTWREPIFASPFSSRMDANYGRPLYNITSMDLAFNMMDLRNMIHIADENLVSYRVDIKDIQLCYQVETVPDSFSVPSYTVTPYRRFVPYITDSPSPMSTTQDNTNVTLTSGVYTLNEIPTAIWIFAAPVKAAYQNDPADSISISGTTVANTWANNKLFGYMTHISISCANTTQILNTATVHDLYRIAKANGCQDDFESWSRIHPYVPRIVKDPLDSDAVYSHPGPWCGGAGSVLRLIPGTDIVLPEQELIPGSNADNIVFQVSATFDIPKCAGNYSDYALWILFEYVGVATITPGQCNITMNPLGNGSPATSAPVISGEANTSATTAEGSGWLDKIKNAFSKAHQWVKDKKLISKGLSMLPGAYGTVLSGAADALGYGYGAAKRPRLTGGAVMGMGDFC
ncbi:MAG: hypothetical protein J5767_14140 [Paludibacteraceae bacterium]|nr:hypothetical protein [Paludibacteraceae bacterium]